MALTIKQDSEYKGGDRWQWRVWLDGPDEELDAIDHGVYTLHRTFPNPVRTVSERASKFLLKAEGWGAFTLYCKCVRKEGSVLKLSHELDLRQPEAPSPEDSSGGVDQDQADKARMHQSMGDLERRLGNIDVARRHYESALLLFEAKQDHLGKVHTLSSLGDLEHLLGNHEDARRYYLEARSLYHVVGDRRSEAQALRSLGDLEAQRGNPEDARRSYDRALYLVEAGQDPIGKMLVILSRARFERVHGNVSQAERLYRRVLEQAQLLGLGDHPTTQQLRTELQEMLLKSKQDSVE